MKNILFLVTGMTPQIITETVWALACDPDNDIKWIPDEIHVLSTDDGLNQIRSRLFSEKEGAKFEQFKQFYPQIAQVGFDSSDYYLHVITDQYSTILKDLKTPEDNERAADAICEKIREFTRDDEVVLHVSIAGGRKTMGFYAGYALSLYGRSQDRMSHVLVEERFESARDFFYPVPDDNVYVTNKDGIELRARDAKIWLAQIPFVRMKQAIHAKHQLNHQDSFTQVVNKINDSFNDTKIRLNLHDQSLVVNEKWHITSLSPKEYAILYWFADLRKRGLPGIVMPTSNITSKNLSKTEAIYIAELTKQFCTYYEQFKNLEDKDISADKKFFESSKSLLKDKLIETLGLELANKISINQMGKGKPFFLDLPVDAIEFVDNFNN